MLEELEGHAKPMKRCEEKREECDVPRAGQAVWEMAATSLHDDFLDPEQRHERTLHRAGADSDLMV